MIRLKVILCILVLSYLGNYAWAQDAKIDSLKALLKTANEDTIKVNILLDLSKRLYSLEPDESIRLGNQANDLAEKSGFKKGIAYALKNIGLAYYTKGKYSETLGYWQQSLKIFEVIGDQMGVSNLLNNIGAIYFNLGNDDRAIEYYLKSLRVSEQLGEYGSEFSANAAISNYLAKPTPRLNLDILSQQNEHISQADLKRLQKANVTKDLHMKKAKLTDIDLEGITGMRLETLHIPQNDVSDLHALKSMKTLTDLNVSQTNLGTDGMKVIGGLTSLRDLNLSKTQIGNGDLNYLYGLASLRNVDMRDCEKITSAAIKKLKDALPLTRMQEPTQEEALKHIIMAQGQMGYQHWLPADRELIEVLDQSLHLPELRLGDLLAELEGDVVFAGVALASVFSFPPASPAWGLSRTAVGLSGFFMRAISCSHLPMIR